MVKKGACGGAGLNGEVVEKGLEKKELGWNGW
jgi:hypothetical protein